MSDIVERLRGVYRVAIKDGLGPVGAGEEPDNPDAFVRHFETPPIQHEAADIITALRARYEPEGEPDAREYCAHLDGQIKELLAELERKDAALRGFVRQYDAENPLRTANFHPQGCRCMRCARDAAEATFGPEHKESEPDWFWRDLDPDDSGHTISEALSHVPHGVVCAIHSSYAGPSFFAAVVPVLDPESDNTEEIRADTEDECVAAVKERFAARAALSAQKEE